MLTRKRLATALRTVEAVPDNEGTIHRTALALDIWMGTLPQPSAVALEATVSNAWMRDFKHSECDRCQVGVAVGVTDHRRSQAEHRSDRCAQRAKIAREKSIDGGRGQKGPG
jgi:hypothetical protein